ncbi:MAG: DUF2937 family protein [Pseudomonadota bacterium]
MILRVVAFAFGLTGAAGLSQFPEFAQQYLQRLAGKVDQLEAQVAEIDASAARFNMTRADYLADLGTSRTGAEAARKAEGEISLFARLSANLDGFREAGAFGRLAQAYRVADVDVVQRTATDYQPAVPLTVEGAAFAGVGFVAGYGAWSLLALLLGWPLRRLRRRQLQRQVDAMEAASSADARYEVDDEDDDDIPFVEYEGDISYAVRKVLPPIALTAQDGTIVDLAMLTAPAVIFTYPLMGRPGVAFPDGWEEVEEAENATSLACSFRDTYEAVRRAGIGEVFGVSGQSEADQAEAAHRLALPYTLLSDPRLELAFALDLPRFILAHELYVSPTILVTQGRRVLAAMHPIRNAETAAPRLLAKLEEARTAHQEARTA